MLVTADLDVGPGRDGGVVDGCSRRGAEAGEGEEEVVDSHGGGWTATSREEETVGVARRRVEVWDEGRVVKRRSFQARDQQTVRKRIAGDGLGRGWLYILLIRVRGNRFDIKQVPNYLSALPPQYLTVQGCAGSSRSWLGGDSESGAGLLPHGLRDGGLVDGSWRHPPNPEASRDSLRRCGGVAGLPLRWPVH